MKSGEHWDAGRSERSRGKPLLQSLFIAARVEGHGFGAEVFGVPVEEEGVAAWAVVVPGEVAV
jgi:hypothetical protein